MNNRIRNYKSVYIVGLMLSLVMVFTMLSPQSANAAIYKNVPADVNLLLKKINDLRVSKGLHKVKINMEISTVALEWSTKMADGKVPFQHNYGWVRDPRVPKGWEFGAEIIAMNNGSVEGLYNQWLNSPRHYMYMTAKYLNTVGIGIAASNTGLYGTVDFAEYNPYPKNTYTSYPTPKPAPKYVTKGAIGTFYKKNSKMTGAPTSNEKKISKPAGYYQTFKNGKVYYSKKTGAHFVKYGTFNNAYSSAKSEKGVLGYPTSEIKNFKYRSGGSYQSFEKGLIIYSSKTGARVLTGTALSKWKSLGWERSKLKLPTSGQYKSGKYYKQKFEKGYMYWTSRKNLKVKYS